jgi:hypothetical protein
VYGGWCEWGNKRSKKISIKFDCEAKIFQTLEKMKGNRLFVGTCCALGVVAFSQLLIAGMALAVRIADRNLLFGGDSRRGEGSLRPPRS